MIKKRKNIDLMPDVLEAITIAAKAKGFSAKRFIEMIIEDKAYKISRETAK